MPTLWYRTHTYDHLGGNRTLLMDRTIGLHTLAYVEGSLRKEIIQTTVTPLVKDEWRAQYFGVNDGYQ